MKTENDTINHTTDSIFKQRSLGGLFTAVVVIFLLGNLVGTFLGEVFFNYVNDANRLMVDAIISQTLITAFMTILLKQSGLYIIHMQHLLRQLFVVAIAFMLTLTISIIPDYFADIFAITGTFGSSATESDYGTGSQLLLQFAATVFIVVIAEELIFRGAIFGALRKRRGFWLAALISSLLFALLHGISLLFVVTFFAGLLLSFIYERTGSILVPILVHMLHNALGVISNHIGSNSTGSDNGLLFHSTTGNLLFLTGMVLISFGLLILILKVTEKMQGCYIAWKRENEVTNDTQNFN